ncbi:hypothetical protein [Paracidovorax anthurii]|nr:hypothetical protein [Paracidovorax anthurii]
MVHTGDVFFAGTKYKFQAGYQVPQKAFVEALGVLCKNPLLCAAAAAAPAIMDWMARGKVSVNPNEADYPNKPFLREEESDGKQYRVVQPAMPDQWYGSPTAACSAALDWAYNVTMETGAWRSLSKAGPWVSASQQDCSAALDGVRKDGTKDSLISQWTISSRTATNLDMLPRSMDDIAPYMDLPDTPSAASQLVRDLLDKGADIQLPSTPTVSGPSQVPVSREETANPDGSKTVKETVNNYKTDGNKITNTTTVTINQTCTAQGACSPTTTTNTHPDEANDDADDPKDEDPPSDTPLSDIPKLYERKYPDGMTGIWDEKSQQIKKSNIAQLPSKLMPVGFVAGTCPNWRIDLSLTRYAQYGSVDVAPPCWLWSVAKAILLVTALIVARSLVFGG